MANNFVFETDMAAKTIHVVREFNAPIEKVWKAWTDADVLDKWIGPKPYTAVTKIMDFSVGGIWLYAMVSPEGQKHWVYAEFTAIESGSSFSSTGRFCDGDGNPVPDGPKSYRNTKFSSIDGNRTKVDTVITFEEESTIRMFVEGGFKEGTAITFDQLSELLASKTIKTVA
jgi:uncharacterized protein YndB with AHSA1/START domain